MFSAASFARCGSYSIDTTRPFDLARAEAEPDAAVTARGADLEHRLRVAHRHEHAQEPAVFFRDREQPFVGGLDALENRFDLRRQGAR